MNVGSSGTIFGATAIHGASSGTVTLTGGHVIGTAKAIDVTGQLHLGMSGGAVVSGDVTAGTAVINIDGEAINGDMTLASSRISIANGEINGDVTLAGDGGNVTISGGRNLSGRLHFATTSGLPILNLSGGGLASGGVTVDSGNLFLTNNLGCTVKSNENAIEVFGRSTVTNNGAIYGA